MTDERGDYMVLADYDLLPFISRLPKRAVPMYAKLKAEAARTQDDVLNEILDWLLMTVISEEGKGRSEIIEGMQASFRNRMDEDFWIDSPVAKEGRSTTQDPPSEERGGIRDKLNL